MHKPLYVYGASDYVHSVEQGLPDLKATAKQLCRKSVRRVDRFTQLALIGSFMCSDSVHAATGMPMLENTGIYLSSLYGSLNNTNDVLSEIYQRGQQPGPLSFINTVSNTACFHLASQLGLSSRNQFVTRQQFTLEAGLKLAAIDLQLGRVDAALIGLVSEGGSHLKQHRERLQIEKHYHLGEGSHWLYLSHQLNDKKPLARITAVKEPLSERDMLMYLKSLSPSNNSATHCTHTNQTTYIGFSDSVSLDNQPDLALLSGVKSSTYGSITLRHEFTTALHIQGFLAQAKVGDAFIYVDTNQLGQWSIICIDKII